MADLMTIAGIEAELSATADYDVESDVGKAKRRVAALRRKLDFPQSMGRDQQSMQFAMQAIENQLQQAIAFVQANASPSEAQQLANPSVVHADFSTFRGSAFAVQPCGDYVGYGQQRFCRRGVARFDLRQNARDIGHGSIVIKPGAAHNR